MEHFYCLHDPPCDILRHAEAHVGQSAKQRTRPLGNHFPMQHMLQRPALPRAVQRDIHLPGRQYLLHAHGDAPFRHSRQIAALVAEGIDRPGLPADGQHTGPQIGIRVRGDGVIGLRRLVEGHMTVDAQSAKAHIHAAQTGDQLVVLFFMSRLREMPLRLRHDQTEAMTLGTRIVVMKDGVIQQVDTPQNLYEKPCNLFVAGFMGSPQMNFLDATVKVEGDIANLVIAGHSIPLPPAKSKKLIDGGYDGKVVTFGIRPEDVYDSEMYIETSPQSVFTSTIKVYELLGAEVYLYFDLDEFPMTARVDSRTTARPGDTVKFALDVEKIHVFDKETEQVITN